MSKSQEQLNEIAKQELASGKEELPTVHKLIHEHDATLTQAMHAVVKGAKEK